MADPDKPQARREIGYRHESPLESCSLLLDSVPADRDFTEDIKVDLNTASTLLNMLIDGLQTDTVKQCIQNFRTLLLEEGGNLLKQPGFNGDFSAISVKKCFSMDFNGPRGKISNPSIKVEDKSTCCGDDHTESVSSIFFTALNTPTCCKLARKVSTMEAVQTDLGVSVSKPVPLKFHVNTGVMNAVVTPSGYLVMTSELENRMYLFNLYNGKQLSFHLSYKIANMIWFAERLLLLIAETNLILATDIDEIVKRCKNMNSQNEESVLYSGQYGSGNNDKGINSGECRVNSISTATYIPELINCDQKSISKSDSHISTGNNTNANYCDLHGCYEQGKSQSSMYPATTEITPKYTKLDLISCSSFNIEYYRFDRYNCTVYNANGRLVFFTMKTQGGKGQTLVRMELKPFTGEIHVDKIDNGVTNIINSTGLRVGPIECVYKCENNYVKTTKDKVVSVYGFMPQKFNTLFPSTSSTEKIQKAVFYEPGGSISREGACSNFPTIPKRTLSFFVRLFNDVFLVFDDVRHEWYCMRVVVE